MRAPSLYASTPAIDHPLDSKINKFAHRNQRRVARSDASRANRAAASSVRSADLRSLPGYVEPGAFAIG